MKKTYSFIVSEKVFGTDTLFVLGCGISELKRILSRKGITYDDTDTDVMGTVLKERLPNGKNLRILWSENVDVDTISHEMLHLVVRICEDKGVPIKANIDTGECGDETAAYLMGFYMNEVLKRIGRFK